jgi:opacity protein-like surface antigen
MTRLTAAAVAIFLISSCALAQDSTPRFQVFGGYSLLHTDNGGLNGPLLNSLLEAPNGSFGLNSNFNGWNAEAQYNANRWFGLVADVSGNYGGPFTASSGSGVTGLPGGTNIPSCSARYSLTGRIPSLSRSLTPYSDSTARV